MDYKELEDKGKVLEQTLRGEASKSLNVLNGTASSLLLKITLQLLNLQT